MTEDQQHELRQILRRGAKNYGFSTDGWTLARIRRVINETFGVAYADLSGVWRLLHRMGWTNLLPDRRAVERDEDAIAAWSGSTPLQSSRSRCGQVCLLRSPGDGVHPVFMPGEHDALTTGGGESTSAPPEAADVGVGLRMNSGGRGQGFGQCPGWVGPGHHDEQHVPALVPQSWQESGLDKGGLTAAGGADDSQEALVGVGTDPVETAHGLGGPCGASEEDNGLVLVEGCRAGIGERPGSRANWGVGGCSRR
ncbi:winged helix-turn-helix domain-containing protein [Nocardiopsis dassonvillei]|nr:winged helix-turn-helix domain-containing protein [Nocardiopsis dassonvillei]MCP3013064.1 winged helix-turn-helix domain-containing protein [Nocardiopsis dassonvillei]